METVIGPVIGPGDPGFDRLARLKRQALNAPRRICMERARIVTESYKKTEGMPAVLRRAHALHDILTRMSVYILPDELIVGHQCTTQRSAPLFPEFAIDWLESEFHTLTTRDQDRFEVSEDVERELRESIIPYWKGKTLKEHLMASVTPEIQRLRDAMVFDVGFHENGGYGHINLDYGVVLRDGFSGIRRRVEQKMREANQADPDDYQRLLFYRACLVVCDAASAFIRRYAAEAKRLAELETNAARRAELLSISSVCSSVSEGAPRSFWEAVQLFWFVHLIPQIDNNGDSVSPGRFDQYMYPFYESDIDSGRIDRSTAQEILGCLWVKFVEPIKAACGVDVAFDAGFPMGQNLVVGGVTRSGEDATNDLSYRVLEAQAQLQLPQPNLSVRLHSRTPPAFLRRVCEVIRLGSGLPQVYNDDIFIPALLGVRQGFDVREARDYAAVGCTEMVVKGSWTRCNGGYFNLAKIVELAINNGECMLTGERLGPATGYLESFASFEQFMSAVGEQMNSAVACLAAHDNLIDRVQGEVAPVPFNSLFIEGCLEKGHDLTDGGALYNWTGILGVGIANAGNALTSILKMVFEEGSVSGAEFRKALLDNWRGYEDLKAGILNDVPKYGNDIEYADRMVARITNAFFESLEGLRTIFGGPFVASLFPVTSYVAFGGKTAAGADGRDARAPLADGISPSIGTDTQGPTAVIKSTSRIDMMRCPNGVILNQKFSPAVLAGENNLRKFQDFIRTAMTLKQSQIQINVVSADVLRDAQAHPEKHAGLVVRVAGYSAFFSELSAQVQETIIQRTEQGL